MRNFHVGFIVMLLGSLVTCAIAAQLEPSFNRFLDQAPSDTLLSVIVKLNSPQDIQALDQELHLRKAKLAERHRLVIAALKSNAASTQGSILKQLDQWKQTGQVIGYTDYWIENLIVVYGKAEVIRSLKNDPAIFSIEPNFSAKLIEPFTRGPIRGIRPQHLDEEQTTPGQDATGATRVNRELGITGRGVIVANLDTGVDWDHPALANHFRGRPGQAPMNQCWLDLLSTSMEPSDEDGHGSHTMGTMCGREIRADGDTITIGAAPDAEFICCNAINQSTSDELNNDVITAFQWFADPDGDPNTIEDFPSVVQNSWGVYSWYPEYGPCYSFWNTAILNTEAAGTVVIWSAGNDGPGESTVGIPPVFAFNPTQIFSVGALDVTNHAAPYPIADFSSRGPSTLPTPRRRNKTGSCGSGGGRIFDHGQLIFIYYDERDKHVRPSCGGNHCLNARSLSGL